MQWYQYSKNQIETELKTSAESGLTAAEAKLRLAQYGLNKLPETPPESWAALFFRQFKSPLIYILLICSVIIYFLGQLTDSIIILVVLLVNAAIGTVQEGRAGRMLQSLKKLSSADATVIRDGLELILPETEVTVGDILILQEGQLVAADCRVIFSQNLSLNESMLTGESAAVFKSTAVLTENNLPASSRHNMVFKGTAVLGGYGKMVVVAVGINTEVGKISQLLLQPEEPMPLQKNINALTRIIIYIVGIISVCLFILGVITGRDPREMFSLVVSLAISVIPEGLPLILTIILAHGVWRLSKKNALVKKLQAVEALGQAKVIAVDKTGTITENQMIIKVLFCGKKIFRVTGNGYEPKGAIFLGDKAQNNNADITMAATVASLANKASVQFVEESGSYKVSGDPTEAAMLVFGEKFGFPKEMSLEHYKETGEIPFEHKNKYRAVFYEHESRIFCAVAGAPEVILAYCAYFQENGVIREKTAQDQKYFEQAVDKFSARGLRVVGFAFKHLAKGHLLDKVGDLVFGGFFGIEDSIRPEAKKAVEFAQSSGVKVVMITGDLKNTAKAIAKEVGIFREGDIILTGAELLELGPKQLAEKLPDVSVFARVSPEDKIQIIRAYKALNLVVAMTGDGVNDAPSLVAADLGVAMGKIGTEVAKQAADIVLLDDNLHSIVTAIKEGRVMYANIKKALQFLFSTSLGELLTIVICIFFGLPLPVTAVQILWLNLITDPLSGAALALEKEEGGEAGQKKTKLSKYFLDFPALSHMVIVGLVMAGGAIYIHSLYYQISSAKASTLALTLLAVYQWLNAFNCRFVSQSLFNKRIFGNFYVWLTFAANLGLQVLAVGNPWFNKILGTTPLNFSEWIIIFGLGFSVILADELRKWFYRNNIWPAIRNPAAGVRSGKV